MLSGAMNSDISEFQRKNYLKGKWNHDENKLIML